MQPRILLATTLGRTRAHRDQTAMQEHLERSNQAHTLRPIHDGSKGRSIENCIHGRNRASLPLFSPPAATVIAVSVARLLTFEGMKPATAAVLKLSVDRDPLAVAALSGPEMLCSPPSASSSPLSSSTRPSFAVVVAVTRLPAFEGMNPAVAVVLKLAVVVTVTRLPAFEGMNPAAIVVLKLMVDRDPLVVAALFLSGPEMLGSTHLISPPSGSSSPLSSSTRPSSAVVVAIARLPAFEGMSPATAFVLKLAVIVAVARLPAFEGMNPAAAVALKLVVNRDPLAIASLSLVQRYSAHPIQLLHISNLTSPPSASSSPTSSTTRPSSAPSPAPPPRPPPSPSTPNSSPPPSSLTPTPSRPSSKHAPSPPPKKVDEEDGRQWSRRTCVGDRMGV